MAEVVIASRLAPQHEALTELAEEYLTADAQDEAFTGWVVETLGEEVFDMLDALDERRRMEVLGDLADAFAAESDLDEDYDDEMED